MSRDYNFDPNYFMKLANVPEFGEEEAGFERRNSELSFEVNEEELLVHTEYFIFTYNMRNLCI